MKMRMTALAAGMALVLSACGGGDSAPKSVVKAVTPVETSPASTPVAASVPAAASDPVVASQPAATDPASAPVAASSPAVPAMTSTPVVGIAFFGDDQVEGDVVGPYGTLSMTSPTEPAALQNLLQAKFNDSGVTVANDSSGGAASSLQNELAGVDGMGQREPARMIASGAQIVVQAHSVNDFYGGETVENYQTDLIRWVEDAQAAGLHPVLQEPSPVCNNLDPMQAQYVAIIDSVGSQLNVPVIPLFTYAQSLPGWQSYMQGCMAPNAALNQLEAQQAQAVIAPLVKSLIGE